NGRILFAEIHVQRQRRTRRARRERIRRDGGRWQHGDLVAGEVHRGQPRARRVVQRRARPKAQPRRGDVDAQAPYFSSFVLALLAQRKGVVDFGGGGVIQAEGPHLGQRQVVGHGQRLAQGLGKARALGKMLEQEAPKVVVARGG